MRENVPKLYIVIPCYNEEEILHQSMDILKGKLQRLVQTGKVTSDSRVVCVDDGSKDGTWDIIAERADKDDIFLGLRFSRNYGHQNAILAGMLESRKAADCVVTIDADLQQDVEALDDFLAKYMEGCDVVYGVRNDRDTDKAGKKFTAEAFYKLMKFLGVDMLPNSADYRLLSSKALEALSEYPESNLFLRGLIPTMGFKSDIVYFDVKDRTGGQSKYTLEHQTAGAYSSDRLVFLFTGASDIYFFNDRLGEGNGREGLDDDGCPALSHRRHESPYQWISRTLCRQVIY